MMEMGFDFDQCRIIAPAPGDSKITLTTVRDLVNIVVMAVDYEGEWPAIGGIQGTTVTIDKIIQMGEDVRGMAACLMISSGFLCH